jgi:hypothetical protein
MRAELAGIKVGDRRWRFAIGCTRVVASQRPCCAASGIHC